MGIGDWGLGIGDWGLGPIPIYSEIRLNLKIKYKKKIIKIIISFYYI